MTLLYDYQSVGAIVDYINTTIKETSAAGSSGAGGADSDVEVRGLQFLCWVLSKVSCC